MENYKLSFDMKMSRKVLLNANSSVLEVVKSRINSEWKKKGKLLSEVDIENAIDNFIYIEFGLDDCLCRIKVEE